MPTSAACRLLLAALVFSPFAYAQTAVPLPGARITDLTGTLSGDAVNRIETKLADFEARRGSPVAVLMVSSTRPEDLDGFGGRVARAWRLRSRAFDDGVILVVAKNDRRVRLEVGHGLAQLLPDALANRLISETMIPLFEIGDYDRGIEAGVDRVTAVIDGEPLPPPDRAWEASGTGWGNRLPLILAVGVAAMLVARYLRPAEPWLGTGRPGLRSNAAPRGSSVWADGGASGRW